MILKSSLWFGVPVGIEVTGMGHNTIQELSNIGVLFWGDYNLKLKNLVLSEKSNYKLEIKGIETRWQIQYCLLEKGHI